MTDRVRGWYVYEVTGIAPTNFDFSPASSRKEAEELVSTGNWVWVIKPGGVLGISSIADPLGKSEKE